MHHITVMNEIKKIKLGDKDDLGSPKLRVLTGSLPVIGNAGLSVVCCGTIGVSRGGVIRSDEKLRY